MDNFRNVFIGSSSNILSMAHDDVNNVLRVVFQPSKKNKTDGYETGDTYVYQNVPSEVVNGFELAVENGLSVGSLFIKEIVKNPETYPFEKFPVGGE